MRMLRREGIRLLPGTDDGLGISVHRELELYVRAGMTPAEALRAGTLDAAVYLGQDHDRGTIARGKLADMVLVAGDPTRDISEVRRPRMVMAGGAVYFPAEIYRALGIRPFAEPPRMTLPTPKPEHPDVSQALVQPASNSAGAVPGVH
jgi:adenine deaminase